MSILSSTAGQLLTLIIGLLLLVTLVMLPFYMHRQQRSAAKREQLLIDMKRIFEQLIDINRVLEQRLFDLYRAQVDPPSNTGGHLRHVPGDQPHPSRPSRPSQPQPR